jgi:hypothetical protein
VDNTELSQAKSNWQSKFVEAEDAICNMSSEMECLRLIKDIRDELKMIERVLEGQKEAVCGLLANIKRSMGDVHRESSLGNVQETESLESRRAIPNEVEDLRAKLAEGLELRLIKVRALQSDVEMVEGSVC